MLEKDEETTFVGPAEYAPTIDERSIAFEQFKHLGIHSRGFFGRSPQSFGPCLESEIGFAHRQPQGSLLKTKLRPIGQEISSPCEIAPGIGYRIKKKCFGRAAFVIEFPVERRNLQTVVGE